MAEPRASPLSALVPSLAAHLVPCLLLDESTRFAVALGQRDLKELRESVIESKKKEREKYIKGCKDLIIKAHEGDIGQVRAIVASGLYNFDLTMMGWTAVIAACQRDSIEMLTLLVACRGVSNSINSQCPQMGRTALHFVAYGASEEEQIDPKCEIQMQMACLLLSIRGIDVNKESHHGDTPLDFAFVESGPAHPLCQLLRMHGAVHGKNILEQLAAIGMEQLPLSHSDEELIAWQASLFEAMDRADTAGADEAETDTESDIGLEAFLDEQQALRDAPPAVAAPPADELGLDAFLDEQQALRDASPAVAAPPADEPAPAAAPETS